MKKRFDMNTLEKELENLLIQERSIRKRIDDIKEQKKIIDQLPPENKFAIILHDSTCNSNHTDDCDWYYEIPKGVHNWEGRIHQDYLKRARKILIKCEEIGAKYDLVEAIAKIILNKIPY
jgi:hypothetical protein